MGGVQPPLEALVLSECCPDKIADYFPEPAMIGRESDQDSDKSSGSLAGAAGVHTSAAVAQQGLR